MDEYKELDLVCVGCGMGFVWTSGEQKFMNALLNEGKIQKVIQPKRCPACRMKKKAEKEAKEMFGGY